ncbi:2'-5' RNA ligase family protein [Actinomadura livida]|uniref:2'-5' RNA ligase n=1 Tax=Actinomadura livida TaxID=79909 RepID=A0A7W7IJB0_9ACTN|nr:MULTISPECIES: 2'-5' RNA ligase family protein [Actinomadura]MBB4778079.1 2'-5' RNA ligase [Actinomadura catellatispora]GGT96690.1 phosphoesterase [Actinomadura livida]
MVADRAAHDDAAEGPGGGPAASGAARGTEVRAIGVAIPIPDPHGALLQAKRASFGDPLATAIPTHITLLPPTEVPEHELGAVADHLRDIARTERPFRIKLRGSGTFRPVSPVVFVALAEGISGCERLQARILSGPLARPLPFPYHPHVTIAHHLPEEVMDRAFKELAGYSADFDVWGFSLYEHGQDGVWRPQYDFVFGEGGQRRV